MKKGGCAYPPLTHIQSMHAGFSFSYSSISLLLRQPLSIKKSYAGAIQEESKRKEEREEKNGEVQGLKEREDIGDEGNRLKRDYREETVVGKMSD